MLDLRTPAYELDTADCVDLTLLASLAPQPARGPAMAEPVDFELPRWIWGAMGFCYLVFLTGLLVATGRSTMALFSLAVSTGYGLVYFGTAGILAAVNPSTSRSLFAKGIGSMQTWTGPMSRGAVAAQVLTIPICVAAFGIGIAIIRACID